MSKNHYERGCFWRCRASALAIALGGASIATAGPIETKVAAFRHIDFGDLPPTQFSQEPSAPSTMKIIVDRSSSFLLQAFDTPVPVKSLRFEWKSEGPLAVAGAAKQKSKAGDDARLRIGLILAGEAPTIPFFAPGWIKVIRDHLKHPAGRVVFVLAGTPLPPKATWPSPYNSDMLLAAPEDHLRPDGWHESRFDLDRAERVVGLWIMADGDNTNSTFTTWLRHLTLD